jgi:hypothetical protein
MELGPFPSEQVHDPQFEQLVAHLTLRPQMYVNPVTLTAVCAYLGGFDAARSGGPLIGFQQWLVVRRNGGNNLHWTGLVRLELMTETADAGVPEEQTVASLGRLLAEFFEYRRTNGITKVFNDYARWLLRRAWYTGPLRAARVRGQTNRAEDP